MDIPIIIQARVGSSRLPGKTLRPLLGKPMLSLLLERLSVCGLPLAVATSRLAADDAVEALCGQAGVRCLRGPLEDVAGRFVEAVRTLGCRAFVRVCADSPFLDPGLVTRAVALFRETSPDLATNLFPRTFPKGQSVEVLDAETFTRTWAEMRLPEDLEHVTRYYYSHPREFRIQAFDAGGDWSGHSLCVDTLEDFRRVERLAAGMDRPLPDYSWRDLVRLDQRTASETGKEGACSA